MLRLDVLVGAAWVALPAILWGCGGKAHSNDSPADAGATGTSGGSRGSMSTAGRTSTGQGGFATAGEAGMGSTDNGDAGSEAGGTSASGAGGTPDGGRSNGGSGGMTDDAGTGGGSSAGGMGTAGQGALAGQSGTAGQAGIAGRGGTGGQDGVAGGGTGAQGGVVEGETRTLELLLDAAPWTVNGRMTGLAVDDAGKVYVSDPDEIFVVEGRSISVYLTQAEVRDLAQPRYSYPFEDIDIGPDGLLYVLTSSALIRSNAPHQATTWKSDLELVSAQQLSVVGADRVAIVEYTDGIWLLTGPNSYSRVYSEDELGSGAGCGLRDIAASRSGVFLYQPGCLGSSLYRGQIDGSSIEELYRAEYHGPSPIHAETFACSARDPLGGFYVLVHERVLTSPRLYHLSEDANGFEGLVSIPTTPTLTQAAESQNSDTAFAYCSLAAGLDGSVYVQNRFQLWKITD